MSNFKEVASFEYLKRATTLQQKHNNDSMINNKNLELKAHNNNYYQTEIMMFSAHVFTYKINVMFFVTHN